MFETVDATVGKFTVSVIEDDQYIGRTIRLGHEWDGWMRQDLPHIYRPGTDILDIGANIGWNSLMFSDYGPVHSFEPIFHEIVSKNVLQNTLSNPVTVYSHGLSSEKRTADMFLPKPDGTVCNYGGTSLHGSDRYRPTPINVKLEKLDDVYHGVPSVMKLDVEGHELEVIKGGITLISFFKPSMYVEIFDYEDTCEITQILKRVGYSAPIRRPEHNYLFISPLLQGEP